MFTKIFETAASELNYIPLSIELSLISIPTLPFAYHPDCLQIVCPQQCGADQYWIPWTEQQGAWISPDGRRAEIVVREDTEDADFSRSMTIALANVIAGACLNLQRQVAIHANAVSIEGRAVAFAGHSGMGKSTLTAFCVNQGAGFITDDIVTVDSEGLVYPGNNRIKLFPHTGESLGLDTSYEMDYKIHYNPVQLGVNVLQRPVPLGILYLLAESEGDNIYSEQVSPSQAVFNVLLHSYYASELIPNHPQILNSYVRLVNQVKVRKLYYPRNFGLLPKVYEFLTKEVYQL